VRERAEGERTKQEVRSPKVRSPFKYPQIKRKEQNERGTNGMSDRVSDAYQEYRKITAQKPQGGTTPSSYQERIQQAMPGSPSTSSRKAIVRLSLTLGIRHDRISSYIQLYIIKAQARTRPRYRPLRKAWGLREKGRASRLRPEARRHRKFHPYKYNTQGAGSFIPTSIIVMKSGTSPYSRACFRILSRWSSV